MTASRKTSDDSEFWQDEANRIADREQIAATGQRMPMQSSLMPAEFAGSHATASRDYRSAVPAAPRPPKSTAQGWFIFFGLLICFAVPVVVFIRGVNRAHSETVVRSAVDVINMQEFLRLKLGDSAETVVLKLGTDKCEVVAQSSGVTPLSFKNANFSNAILTFQNGRLESKAQFGLK